MAPRQPISLRSGESALVRVRGRGACGASSLASDAVAVDSRSASLIELRFHLKRAEVTPSTARILSRTLRISTSRSGVPGARSRRAIRSRERRSAQGRTRASGDAARQESQSTIAPESGCSPHITEPARAQRCDLEFHRLRLEVNQLRQKPMHPRGASAWRRSIRRGEPGSRHGDVGHAGEPPDDGCHHRSWARARGIVRDQRH